MPKLVSILLTLLAISIPGTVLADAAGTAKGVDPAADAAANGATRTLTVGADVFIGDVITTGPKGQVQILFADDTKLVVGPQSSLKIEDYLLRNDGSGGQLAVNMLSGAFRFITGDSAKNRYRIDTPNGTIGVRGTAFDVFVGSLNPDDEDDKKILSLVLMYLGTTQSCAEDKTDCKVSSAQCEITQIGNGQVDILGDSRDTEGQERKDLRAQFLYAINQSSLLREFWIMRAFDCLRKAPEPPPPNPFPAVTSGTPVVIPGD